MPSLPRWMQALPLGWLGALMRKNQGPGPLPLPVTTESPEGSAPGPETPPAPPDAAPPATPSFMPPATGGQAQAPALTVGAPIPRLQPDAINVQSMASAAQTLQYITQEKIRANLASLGNGIRFLPLSDSYTEETAEMRRLYRVMLKEPVIKAALLTKILAVCALDVQVAPASKSARDQEIKDFVQYSINHAKGGIRHLARSILMGGLIEGYSIGEKVWHKPDQRGPWKGKIRLKALKAKDTKFVELLGDQFRNVTAVRDLRGGQNYHPSNFVIWAHLPLFECPTGMSDLRAAYRAYWLIDTAWQLRAVGLERYSLPILIGKYADEQQKGTMETSLALLRSQSWASLPPDAAIEALQLATRGTADFESAIKDLKHDIFLGICGAILQSLEGSISDGRGNSQVHKSTSELFQWMLAAEVGDVLTDQIVPDLVDLNYADADYPTVTLSQLDDSANKVSIEVDKALSVEMQLPLSREETYKRYGRTPPKDEEDTIHPPAKAPPGGATGMAADGQMPLDQNPAPNSKDVADLQRAVHKGEMSREGAIANAMLTMGVGQATAEALFPQTADQGRNWPPLRPETVQLGEGYTVKPDLVPPTTARAELDALHPPENPVPFCGGPGGTPGKCATDKPGDQGGQTHTPPASSGLSGRFQALGTQAKQLMTSAPAAVKTAAAQAGRAATAAVAKLKADLPGHVAMAASKPVESFLFSQAIHAFEPTSGFQTGVKLAVFAAAKAFSIARSRLASAHAEGDAPDVNAIVTTILETMKALVPDATLPTPEAVQAEYEAALSGDTEDMCGGVGGKPGPCPLGGDEGSGVGDKQPATRGEMVGAQRVGTGKDAKIVMADGSPAPDHIKPSMVPPQWTGVIVSKDPKADVLVQGRDAAGRGKTVYSDQFHMRNAAAKFARVREGLAKQKAMYDQNQGNRADPKLREQADCTWLMQEQATRPGSDKDTKSKVKAFGATTLRAEHVVQGPDGVRLQFVGKEGVHHDHLIQNPDLAKMLLDRKASADQRGGKLFDTDYDKVREYAHQLDGGGFSPKDFRTIKATSMAIDALKNAQPTKNEKEYKALVKQVATKVSGVLGNRPAQAVQSYIDPTVWSAIRPARAA